METTECGVPFESFLKLKHFSNGQAEMCFFVINKKSIICIILFMVGSPGFEPGNSNEVRFTV